MGVFGYSLGLIFVGIAVLFLLDQKSKRDTRTKSVQEKKALASAGDEYSEMLKNTHKGKNTLRK